MRLRCQTRHGGEHIGLRRGDATSRLPVPVQRPLAHEREPEAFCDSYHRAIVGQDELGAALDHAAGERHRPHPPADPVARLEHVDLGTGPSKRVCRGQACEPGADDDHPHGSGTIATRP